MKVKNLVFSGAMASILMMGATNAMALGTTKATEIWTSNDGEVVLNNLMTSLDAKKADQSTIADGLLADKTIDTTGANYTTTVDDKTIAAGDEYAVGDTGYELDGVTGGDDIDYSTPGVATQGFSIASSKDTQYATVNATLKSNGEYEINYGGGLTYTTGEVSGTDTDVYTLTYTTVDGDPVFAKKHNAEAAETLTIADLVDGSEEKAAYEKLKNNYDANKITLGELASSLQGQYSTMSTTVGEHNSIASALQEYQDASSNYEGTLAQIVDSSYGAKLSQTLGYDVALKNITDEDVLGTDVVSAIKKVRSDAEAAWIKGEEWISQELGYDTTTTDAKTKLAEAGFESTDFLGAVTENKEAIAQVRSDAEAAWKKGEKWISQELGYDTTKTDAKTKLAEAKFTATDFLGAVTENKGAIEAETTRAQGVEGDLLSLNTSDKTNLVAAINSEMSRAQDVELGLQSSIEGLRSDAFASDKLVLSSANAYTDQRFDSLEKSLSAGIASAAALSSVEVSNVKKGEVSVGGGYGYHNSQSAVAFGAAMGLSDNWSVNAGMGMGFNDNSNITVRAGTNYKFKLF